MKVTISYNVDYEDVPRTMAQMLKNLYDIEYPEAGRNFVEARTNVLTGRYSEALTSIDGLRKELAKLDQKLLDYAHIINGYAKADADLQAGMREEEIYTPPSNPTQEVSAENIIDEEETND